jgi:hypothetical protein
VQRPELGASMPWHGFLPARARRSHHGAGGGILLNGLVMDSEGVAMAVGVERRRGRLAVRPGRLLPSPPFAALSPVLPALALSTILVIPGAAFGRRVPSVDLLLLLRTMEDKINQVTQLGAQEKQSISSISYWFVRAGVTITSSELVDLALDADAVGGGEVDEAGGDPLVHVVEPGGPGAAGEEPGDQAAAPAAGLDELERVVEGLLEPAQYAHPRGRRVGPGARLGGAQDVADRLRAPGEFPAPSPVPASRPLRLGDLLQELDDGAHDAAHRLHPEFLITLPRP